MRVFVIGGRPCSGKTTVAEKIGQKNHIKVISLDSFAYQKSQESKNKKSQLYKWKSLEMIDILQDDPMTLFDDYILFYEELFPLFLEFLRHLEEDQVILESSMLLPKYIKGLENEFDVTVVYLETTDDWVKSTYSKRRYAIEMMKTKKGAKALENLLARDKLFAQYLYKQAKDMGYCIKRINHESEFAMVLKEIEKMFLT